MGSRKGHTSCQHWNKIWFLESCNAQVSIESCIKSIWLSWTCCALYCGSAASAQRCLASSLSDLGGFVSSRNDWACLLVELRGTKTWANDYTPELILWFVWALGVICLAWQLTGSVQSSCIFERSGEFLILLKRKRSSLRHRKDTSSSNESTHRS